MEDNTKPSFSWSPLLSFRPCSHLNNNAIIISDAYHGLRLTIDPEILIDLIISYYSGDQKNYFLQELIALNIIINNNNYNDGKLKYILHWYDRNWQKSLEYYLWSKRSNYIDEFDPTGEKRKKMLQSYLKEKQPPNRIEYNGKRILLPEPSKLSIDNSIREILLFRRTIRNFPNSSTNKKDLSTLLWHGLKDVRNTFYASKNNQLLGYLQSFGVAFDYFLAIYNIEDIIPGIYYYDIFDHQLIEIKKGNFRENIIKNLYNQRTPEKANLTIFLTVDFQQYLWRYRHERALRNIYIESGRIFQRLIFVGTVLNYGFFLTPAVLDSQMSDLLDLDETRQYVLYSASIGIDPRRARK